MWQVPLMYVTDYLHKRMKNEYAGNLVFWCTFCVVGQPLACILVGFCALQLLCITC